LSAFQHPVETRAAPISILDGPAIVRAGSGSNDRTPTIKSPEGVLSPRCLAFWLKSPGAVSLIDRSEQVRSKAKPNEVARKSCRKVELRTAQPMLMQFARPNSS
jgi:hypothetical protein